jgi:hypothetical protein
MTCTLSKHTRILALAILFSLLPLCLFCQNCQTGNYYIDAPLPTSIVTNELVMAKNPRKGSTFLSFLWNKNEEKNCNGLCIEANAGNITCKQDKIVLAGTSSAADAILWWVTPNKNTIQGASIETSEIGLHEVFVKDNNGCIASTFVMVTDGRRYPKVTTLGGLIDCNRPETTLHTATSTQNLLFHWTGPNGFSEVFASPTVEEPGLYLLTSTEPNSGCKSIDSAFVTTNKINPTVKCSIANDINNTKNNVWLSALGSSSGPDFQYRWWSSEGYSVEPYDSTFAKATEADIYTLLVFDLKNGCSATANILVEEENKDLKSKSSPKDRPELHRLNYWVEEPWSWKRIWEFQNISTNYSSDANKSSEEHCTLFSQFNR